MNPPFSASPGVQRIRHEADLRHLRSAFSMLPAGGRLVAITSAGCIPGDAAWSRAFERLDPPPRTVFSIAIDGRAYARRGTTFDTRLTVIDRDSTNAQGVPIDARASVPTAAGLLAAIAANVPQRQAVLPRAAALVPAGDLFGHAAARPAPRKRAAAAAPQAKHAAASPRLGAGGRTRLRNLARQWSRHGRRTGGHPCRRLRALASPDRAHSRRLRTSNTPGAIRRHGGGAPSCAGLPPDAARAYRDGRTAVRRATRKRHPRRSGPRPPSFRALPHRRGLGDRRTCRGR